MRYLFVHQNFPGQFRHVARALAEEPGNEVVGVGEAVNMKGRPPLHPRVRLAEQLGLFDLAFRSIMGSTARGIIKAGSSQPSAEPEPSPRARVPVGPQV